eukprot:GHVQ01024271.1.p1 GENE.GHVQ01024271.1~~GHVQ01024271.1.p1  ORF type:complete len:1105 (-),score=134.59 GHVQ01024271.1:58-3372(-)
MRSYNFTSTVATDGLFSAASLGGSTPLQKAMGLDVSYAMGPGIGWGPSSGQAVAFGDDHGESLLYPVGRYVAVRKLKSIPRKPTAAAAVGEEPVQQHDVDGNNGSRRGSTAAGTGIQRRSFMSRKSSAVSSTIQQNDRSADQEHNLRSSNAEAAEGSAMQFIDIGKEFSGSSCTCLNTTNDRAFLVLAMVAVNGATDTNFGTTTQGRRGIAASHSQCNESAETAICVAVKDMRSVGLQTLRSLHSCRRGMDRGLNSKPTHGGDRTSPDTNSTKDSRSWPPIASCRNYSSVLWGCAAVTKVVFSHDRRWVCVVARTLNTSTKKNADRAQRCQAPTQEDGECWRYTLCVWDWCAGRVVSEHQFNDSEHVADISFAPAAVYQASFRLCPNPVPISIPPVSSLSNPRLKSPAVLGVDPSGACSAFTTAVAAAAASVPLLCITGAGIGCRMFAIHGSSKGGINGTKGLDSVLSRQSDKHAAEPDSRQQCGVDSAGECLKPLAPFAGIRAADDSRDHPVCNEIVASLSSDNSPKETVPDELGGDRLTTASLRGNINSGDTRWEFTCHVWDTTIAANVLIVAGTLQGTVVVLSFTYLTVLSKIEDCLDIRNPHTAAGGAPQSCSLPVYCMAMSRGGLVIAGANAVLSFWTRKPGTCLSAHGPSDQEQSVANGSYRQGVNLNNKLAVKEPGGFKLHSFLSLYGAGREKCRERIRLSTQHMTSGSSPIQTSDFHESYGPYSGIVGDQQRREFPDIACVNINSSQSRVLVALSTGNIGIVEFTDDLADAGNERDTRKSSDADEGTEETASPLWSHEGQGNNSVVFELLNNGCHTGAISSMDVAKLRPLILTCSSQDMSVKVWNYRTGMCLLSAVFNTPTPLCHTHSSTYLRLIAASETMVLPAASEQISYETPVETPCTAQAGLHQKLMSSAAAAVGALLVPSNTTPVCAAIHPSGFICAVSFVDRVRVFYILHDQLALLREIHLRHTRCMRFSNSGGYVAMAVGKVAVVLDSYTGKKVATLKAHAAQVVHIVWSHDDQILATCGSDGYLCEWSVGQWLRISEIVTRGVHFSSLTYDISSRMLHAGSITREVGVTLRTMASGELLEVGIHRPNF